MYNKLIDDINSLNLFSCNDIEVINGDLILSCDCNESSFVIIRELVKLEGIIDTNMYNLAYTDSCTITISQIY